MRPLQARFAKHFGARVLGLIILPSIIYLSCFWVHLAILNQTGTGDDFMEIPFQRTLIGNPHLLASEGADVARIDSCTVLSQALVAEIRHFDILTLRHRDTKAFLHADPEGGKMALGAPPRSHPTRTYSSLLSRQSSAR